MNEGEAVRPVKGSILDLWDNMMKPFDENEEIETVSDGNGNETAME